MSATSCELANIQYVLDYLEKVLNGEISEKNRVHDYEDFIEWYVEEAFNSQ